MTQPIPTLVLTRQGPVLTITLNRPEVRNAFNDAVVRELTQAFEDAASDAAVRAVVLAANGAAFCAGADLHWMRRMADYTRAENVADAAALAQRASYPCAEHESLQGVIEYYLRVHGLPRPRRLAFGIATPISGDAVRMTNRAWAFSIAELQVVPPPAHGAIPFISEPL